MKDIADIRGWFPVADQHVFEHFLGEDAAEPVGDLAEVGVYLARAPR